MYPFQSCLLSFIFTDENSATILPQLMKLQETMYHPTDKGGSFDTKSGHQMATTENIRREPDKRVLYGEEKVINKDTKINFFEMFQTITFLLILVSLVAVIFLVIKNRQSNQANFVGQNRSMELMNLSNSNTYEFPDCSKRRVV